MKKLFATFALISLMGPTAASALSVTLSPTSIGNFNQWSVTGTDKMSAVATNDGNTSYIQEAVDGQAQTFFVSNAGIPSWVAVQSVTLNAVARQQVGTSTVALRVEKGTTTLDISEDTPQTLTPTYATISRTMTTNPFTGLSWTTAEVNNWSHAFGFVHGALGASTDRSRITQASVVVDYVNLVPSASPQSVSVNEDANVVITLAGTDPESQPLTFATTSNPSNGTLTGFNASTGEVTYTPDLNFHGTDTFEFIANDSLADSSTSTVTITVSPVNDAPSYVVASSTIVVDEDSGAFSLENWATSSVAGPGNESTQLLDFIVGSNAPTYFASLPTVSATGTLYFTPAANVNGSVTITAKIHDNGGTSNGGVDESASSTLSVSITPVNDVPVFGTVPNNRTVNENVLVRFRAVATDVDGNTLTYSASNLPTGATFNPSTRFFDWRPDYTQAGVYTGVHFEVTDGATTTSRDITITVRNVNRPPVLASIGNKTVDENTNLAFTISASDPDGDTVDLSAAGLPTGAVFSTSTGEFSWTPDFAQSGNHAVTFTASANGQTDSEIVSIDVGNVNRSPALSAISDITSDEQVAISFNASASDPDGDMITYDLTGSAATAGATINSSTGAFMWTPTETDGQNTYTATITATDSSTSTPLSDSVTFDIIVGEVNIAPVSSDLSTTVNEDESATTTLSAIDADDPAQTISFSIVTQPSNGSLVLTGDQAFYTPNPNWFGTDTYEYVADDGVDVGATSTVTVTVTSVNDLPVVTLLGSTPLLLTVHYAGYADPMVSATDVEDGDISASAVASGPVDTSVVGSYVITYSVTDSDMGSSSVTRDVSILHQLGGSGGAAGTVGCRDPRATNYNPSAAYDGITCTYPAPQGEVLGASTSTPATTPTATSSEPIIIVSVSTSTSTPNFNSFIFTRNLRFGMTGDDVTELQKILIVEGFLQISNPTRFFGPLTRAALMKWQAKHVIPATGLFGALSREFLSK